MNMDMRKFGHVMNIVCNLIICSVMTVLVFHLGGAPMIPAVLIVGIIQSFFVGFFIGDMVPGLMWGRALCAKLNLGKVGTYLLANAVHCVCMVTLISFLANFLVYGFTPMTIQAFVGTYIPVMGAAYLVMLVIMGPVEKLAVSMATIKE